MSYTKARRKGEHHDFDGLPVSDKAGDAILTHFRKLFNAVMGGRFGTVLRGPKRMNDPERASPREPIDELALLLHDMTVQGTIDGKSLFDSW